MNKQMIAAVALTLLPFFGNADDTLGRDFDRAGRRNNTILFAEGRHIFRYDTFGDEAFWGDTLKLHLALAGANNGGVGPGVSPRTALAVGLKVDVQALPLALQKKLRAGEVNLDDPATTLALLQLNSVVGVTGNPGQANYVASKAGLIGMSKAFAQEVASRGITVNCVAPGFMTSAMTDALNDAQKEGILSRIPAGAMGSGEDIGAAVVYLASNEAGYVTGQTLHVNGGMAMP